MLAVNDFYAGHDSGRACGVHAALSLIEHIKGMVRLYAIGGDVDFLASALASASELAHSGIDHDSAARRGRDVKSSNFALPALSRGAL